MFSRSKEPEVAPAPQPAAGKRTARSAVPSIISGDLVVKGTLVSAGDIQIDGRVEGDIRAGALVVGEKASIEGDNLPRELGISAGVPPLVSPALARQHRRTGGPELRRSVV